MPDAIKFNSSSTESQSLRKGNIYIGVGDVSKGPTSLTGFKGGVNLGSNAYLISLHRGSGVFSHYLCSDDSELISKTNKIDTSVVRTTKEQCFEYFAWQSDKILLNRDYEPIVTDGLVLNLDGGFLPSYPGTFSISYDISNLSTQPNSIVKNFSPQLTSWSVRRSDISLVTNIEPPFPGAQVWSSTINTTSYVNTLHRVWSFGSSNGIIGSLGSGFYRYYMWVRGASHNAATASFQLDISDGGGIAQSTLTIGTNSSWRVASTWDNVSSNYNADKFFDYFLSGINGDTFYISSIVIAAYDVANANDLTKLHSFPGPIDYGKTASVQKQGALTNGVNFSPTENSFIFDGSNDYIEVGSENSLNFATGDFTILCWVGGISAYPGSGKSIIWKGSRFDGNLSGWSMTWAGSPQDLYFIISSDSQRLEARTVPNSGLNGWSGYKMIGMQRSNGSIRQINGTTITNLGTFTGNVDSTSSVMVARNGHYNSYLSCSVNKVFIYNRALSQAEITQNYFQSNIILSGIQFALDAGNILSYPTSGTTAFSLTGSNNGTLVNGVAFSNQNGGTWIFDGSNDYIDFTATNLSTTATVEMLCKIGTGYSGKMFMGWLYYDIWCSGGAIGFNTGNGDLYGISQGTVNALGIVNKWAHYIFEFRSDVSYTNNKIYINGNIQTLSQIGGTENAGSRNFNSGNGRIGIWRGSTTSYNMPMDLSMFRVYNRSFSSSEVLHNFNVCRSRFSI